MILGMSIATYTTIHVIISLVAIVTGFIALFAMIANKPLGFWNAVFLWTTIATSVTGFGFPFNGVTPGIIVGIISLVILAVAVVALYAKRVAGPWRWIYILCAAAAQWFNVLVLITQSFQKIDTLKALAPTQSEPPFQIAQGTGLAIVVLLTILALRGFKPAAA